MNVEKAHTVWIASLLLIACACNLQKAGGQPQGLPENQKGFISIDCGRVGNVSYRVQSGITWTSDEGYITSGSLGYAQASFQVPTSAVEYSLRYFPVGDKNCYHVGPVIPGNKYLVRIRVHYFNYDNLMRFPHFHVSVGPTLVDNLYPSNWPYGEYILDATDTTFDVCFIRVEDGGDPFVSGLEVRPLGQSWYNQASISNSVLTNWRRLSCGLDPGEQQLAANSIVYPDDPLDRMWGSDQERLQNEDNFQWGPLLTWPVNVTSKEVNITLNTVPPIIYSQATIPINETDLTYELIFDNTTGLPFMLYLYFAELDDTVKIGDRVFDILINEDVVYPNLDIRKQGGSVGAINIPLYLDFSFLMKNPGTQQDTSAFTITLSPKKQSKLHRPIISGIENYIVIPVQAPTKASDVEAMLGVRSELVSNNSHPVLSSWGGDPCLPAPWERVVCQQEANNDTVVTGLDLSGLSLNGTIPAAIANLSSLENMLCNDNNFVGSLPSSFPLNLSLIRVENNRLTGPLPTSLASLKQLTFLNVSNNPLSGGVDPSLFNLATQLSANFSLTSTYLCPSAISQCQNAFVPLSSPPYAPPTNGAFIISPPPNAPLKGGGNGARIAAIVGGIVAAVVLLAALLAVLILCTLRSKKQPFFSSIGGGSTHRTSSTVMERVKKLHEGLLGSPGSGARFGVGGRIFTLKDMEAATSRWSPSNILGVGGFGIVYKASFDGKDLAVKKRSGSSMQGEREFYNEVNLLSRVRHKHLVTLAGYCNEGANQILVYEYMANGTVRDHLYDDKGEPLGLLDWRMRLGIALGAARGIEYLHTGSEPSIIHRDIKTSNILLDENFMAKVADFGLSKLGPEGFNTHVSTAVKGTAGYLDPEYYTVQQLTHKSDVFSFGVVLLELITGREPINHNRPRSQWNIVEWARPELQSGNLRGIVDPSLGESWSLDPMWKLAEIGILCVEPHGENRPTMTEVVRELKEAVDMEFGMHDYISAQGFDGTMDPPCYSANLEPASDVLLDVEAR